MIETVIRLRMSTTDGHYAGGLVDGARVLQLFSDAVTEGLIRHDGDEGLMRAMHAEFLGPVWVGDYIEIRCKLVKVGNTSRTFQCEAYKVVAPGGPHDSSALALKEPLLVTKAEAIAVVPADKQQKVD